MNSFQICSSAHDLKLSGQVLKNQFIFINKTISGFVFIDGFLFLMQYMYLYTVH